MSFGMVGRMAGAGLLVPNGAGLLVLVRSHGPNLRAHSFRRCSSGDADGGPRPPGGAVGVGWLGLGAPPISPASCCATVGSAAYSSPGVRSNPGPARNVAATVSGRGATPGKDVWAVAPPGAGAGAVSVGADVRRETPRLGRPACPASAPASWRRARPAGRAASARLAGAPVPGPAAGAARRASAGAAAARSGAPGLGRGAGVLRAGTAGAGWRGPTATTRA